MSLLTICFDTALGPLTVYEDGQRDNHLQIHNVLLPNIWQPLAPSLPFPDPLDFGAILV